MCACSHRRRSSTPPYTLSARTYITITKSLPILQFCYSQHHTLESRKRLAENPKSAFPAPVIMHIIAALLALLPLLPHLILAAPILSSHDAILLPREPSPHHNADADVDVTNPPTPLSFTKRDDDEEVYATPEVVALKPLHRGCRINPKTKKCARPRCPFGKICSYVEHPKPSHPNPKNKRDVAREGEDSEPAVGSSHIAATAQVGKRSLEVVKRGFGLGLGSLIGRSAVPKTVPEPYKCTKKDMHCHKNSTGRK